ncbi:hypothetical protein [Amaricoccus sp. W119]|uniref:hypothetical protein n=1 Tax=Amaricoccus sp. W119 TaxID=3391833 RepID=UPI0039A580BC
MRALVAALFLLALSACSTNTRQLSIETNPSGATFYEEGTGATHQAPITLYYSLPETSREADGCFTIRPYVIYWTSGAAVQGANRLCGDNLQWAMRYDRPVGHPNLAADLRVAQYQQAQAQFLAQQQQLAAAETLAAIAGTAVQGLANNQTAQVSAPQIMQERRVRCSSRVVFSTIYTDCN